MYSNPRSFNWEYLVTKRGEGGSGLRPVGGEKVSKRKKKLSIRQFYKKLGERLLRSIRERSHDARGHVGIGGSKGEGLKHEESEKKRAIRER